MATSRSHNSRPGFFRLVAGNFAIFGLLLIVIEGLASYGIVVRFLMKTNIVAERRHTKYDSELGWVNEPNVDIPDMYGRGIYLRTNAQGFRNNYNFSVTLPAGKSRIICSGDSFTLGYGVDNDQTWCSRLSVLEPRFETVNMGQGGYGIDQAYLWYKRDAADIAHQVHVLAFITDDFRRMESDTFLGYDKPVLDIENGALVIKNVPVPKQNYYFPTITQYYYRQSLKLLRTLEIFNSFAQRIGHDTVNAQQPTWRRKKEKDDHVRAILHTLFTDLKNINEKRSSKLVLVYLPDMNTLAEDGPGEWIRFLNGESRSLGIPLINVVDEFRSLPYREVIPLFISKEQIGRGHLSAAGNNLVARVIHDQLVKHRVISHAVSVQPRQKFTDRAITSQF